MNNIIQYKLERVKIEDIELFNMHKGNWEVKLSYGSVVALSFWKSVIDEYTQNDNTFEDGIFIFESK